SRAMRRWSRCRSADAQEKQMRTCLALILFAARTLPAATFGTVIPVTGEAGDLVLDEARARLYILNTTEERVDIYSTAQRKIVSSFSTGPTPLSAALSSTGQYLYVTSYGGSALEIYDLDALALAKRISLPAAPEGVAVGAGERVLITTVGSGTNS